MLSEEWETTPQPLSYIPSRGEFLCTEKKYTNIVILKLRKCRLL